MLVLVCVGGGLGTVAPVAEWWRLSCLRMLTSDWNASLLKAETKVVCLNADLKKPKKPMNPNSFVLQCDFGKKKKNPAPGFKIIRVSR